MKKKVSLSQQPLKKLRRLFVDPASGSSGWALFDGSDFVQSGTVAVNKREHVSQRLAKVFWEYRELDLQFDEVHVEDVPRSRTCHIYVHYSIGVILAALAPKATVQKVDIPVKAWQKHVDWDRENRDSPAACAEERLQICKGAASRDEQAAVGMGLWFLAQETP